MGWLSKAWNAVTGTIKAIIKNPVTAIAAVAIAIYAPAIGLRMLGSMILSNVINAFASKDQPTDGNTNQQGSSQVMPFDTKNKLPAVYGSAYLSGVLTDAKISADNQTMWYVLAVCEAPKVGNATVAIGDMFWNEQKITFSGSEYGRVTKLTNNAGQEDVKIDGNLWIWAYNSSSTPLPLGGINGSSTAIQRLQDTNIPSAARWTSTDTMTDTVFYVVKAVYSTDDGMTGLGGILAEIKINQTGISDGYRPGSAMMEYLTNERYGAGLDSSRIDVSSFLALDSYADELISFKNFGGADATKPRYRFNGSVDTSSTIMTNLMSMAESCDTYVQFNEVHGKWSVIANKSFVTDNTLRNNIINNPGNQTYIQQAINQYNLFILDDTNIIGGVHITPLDLNSTPNEAESGFNDGNNRGRMNYAYADTPENLKSHNEPVNKLSITYKYINDSVRAQYLTNRKLEQCRAEYIVQLTADYSAIQVDAGDVVALSYKPYGGPINGWGNYKIFRVTQVTENKADNGDLNVNLHLSEYAESVYDNRTIHEFSPTTGGNITDPRLLAQPGTPTIIDVASSAYPPSFSVKAEVPRSGVTVGMEFWYGPTQEITDNNFILYSTQYNSDGNQYPVSSSTNPVYEIQKITGLPAGQWWWKVRAIGTSRKSSFSSSVTINWAPQSSSNVGDTDVDTKASTMVAVPFVNWPSPVPPATVKQWPDNTRGILSKVKIVGQKSGGTMKIDFSTSIHADTNSQYNCIEIWKAIASDVFLNKVYSIRHSYDVTSTQTAPAEYIQAVGLDIDYRSSDGGITWNAYDTSSTSKSLTGVLPFVTDGSTYTYQTHVVGSYQLRDGVSQTDYVNAGYRFTSGSSEPDPVHISFITTPTGLSAGKIVGSLNDVAKVSATGDIYARNDSSIIVGDNGGIYFYRNATSVTSQPIQYESSKWIKEESGVLENLFSAYANFPDASDTYTMMVCGEYGTILRSTRQGYVTDTWSATDLRDADNKKIMNHLYCIAGDNSSYLLGDGTWVAVGQAGMILVSGDDGNTWEIKTATKINGSTVTENLRGVRYGGGVWVACGDAGIVIVSYDGGQTWEQTSLPAGFEKRQLNSIDYAPSWDTFNIGGDGCILNSSATTINFLAKLSIVASEKNSFSRLWNRGSHTNIQTTGVATDISTQLLNGQTVSSTVIDTAYYEGDEITYYFVAGSVLGTSSQVVKTGGSVITVTEYKK